jgi:linoleoyl-CoA desaturase
LGHLVEGTEFRSLADGSDIPDTWTVHQLKSSANFSTQGFLASWLFGGLNFQIEHHLFPRVCHVHYRRLAPIVRMTAEEFRLPYVSFKSFPSAVRSHLRYLKQTGLPSQRNPVYTYRNEPN